MRRIKLEQDDQSMFDVEISPVEFDFFQRHVGAFKRMWQEQGKEFWIRFLLSFRSYNVNYGCIKTTKDKTDEYTCIIDNAFIYIQEHYIEGKCTHAKNFIQNVAVVAQYKFRMAFLDPGAYTKNPFYTKETRDIYREMFGQPDVDHSYIKVIALSPLYMRFGGSVCICLKRWLEAEDMAPEDVSYWAPPKHKNKKDTLDSPDWPQFDRASKPANVNDPHFTQYMNERLVGSPEGPMYIKGWPDKTDPRFTEDGNPMYNREADPETDWREDVDYIKYVKLLDYVQRRIVECGAAAWKQLKKKDEATKEFFKSVMNPDPLQSKSALDYVLNTSPSSCLPDNKPKTESKSSKKKKKKDKKKKGKHDSDSASSSVDGRSKMNGDLSDPSAMTASGISAMKCGHCHKPRMTICSCGDPNCKLAAAGDPSKMKTQRVAVRGMCGSCHKPKLPRCPCGKPSCAASQLPAGQTPGVPPCGTTCGACNKAFKPHEDAVKMSPEEAANLVKTSSDKVGKTDNNGAKPKEPKKLHVTIKKPNQASSGQEKPSQVKVHKSGGDKSAGPSVCIIGEKGKESNLELVVKRETKHMSLIGGDYSHTTITKPGEKKDIMQFGDVQFTMTTTSTPLKDLLPPSDDEDGKGSSSPVDDEAVTTYESGRDSAISYEDPSTVSALESDAPIINSLSPQKLPHGTKLISQPANGRKVAMQERLRRKLEQKELAKTLAKIDLSKLEQSNSENITIEHVEPEEVETKKTDNGSGKSKKKKKKSRKDSKSSDGSTEDNASVGTSHSEDSQNTKDKHTLSTDSATSKPIPTSCSNSPNSPQASGVSSPVLGATMASYKPAVSTTIADSLPMCTPTPTLTVHPAEDLKWTSPEEMFGSIEMCYGDPPEHTLKKGVGTLVLHDHDTLPPGITWSRRAGTPDEEGFTEEGFRYMRTTSHERLVAEALEQYNKGNTVGLYRKLLEPRADDLMSLLEEPQEEYIIRSCPVVPKTDPKSLSEKDGTKGKKMLRTCANCGDKEPTPKKYKKCTKCKELSWKNVRYYCGRECQVDDWNERHKKEHKQNLDE